MIMLVAICGCSSAATRMEVAPAEESLSKAKLAEAEEKIIPVVTPRYLDIWLDTGENELGAYHLILHYDEKIVSVHEVLPAPVTSPGSTTSRRAFARTSTGTSPSRRCRWPRISSGRSTRSGKASGSVSHPARWCIILTSTHRFPHRCVTVKTREP